MSLTQCWRWYGPIDIVRLADIRQAGAVGIVHALHHIPTGEVWPKDDILSRKKIIEGEKTATGLKWQVIESLNVHESIKQGRSDRDSFIENYIDSLINIGDAGIKTVCYNFMPILDWTRTNLSYQLQNGAIALKYDAIALAAFDMFILQRKNAELDYSTELKNKAKSFYDKLTTDEADKLCSAILQGVPGSKENLRIEDFQELLLQYEGISKKQLQKNLLYFLERVIPTAEKVGIKMCCHPDDPPFSLFGIPRIVSNEVDLKYLIDGVPSSSNGITFCTGSLAPDPSNNLVSIIKNLGSNIHFVHLRNIKRDSIWGFYESDHLNGDVDMPSVYMALLKESQNRKEKGRDDFEIPFRPDHGHQILDDINKKMPFHGYSAIGRLKGLAELRGLELGLKKSLEL